MNRRILNALNTTAGQLIFALLAGSAYFMVILRLIISLSGGHILLAVWFAPVIVCGAAIVIIRQLKTARENENEKTMLTIFYLHFALFIMGVLAVTAL